MDWSFIRTILFAFSASLLVACGGGGNGTGGTGGVSPIPLPIVSPITPPPLPIPFATTTTSSPIVRNDNRFIYDGHTYTFAAADIDTADVLLTSSSAPDEMSRNNNIQARILRNGRNFDHVGFSWFSLVDLGKNSSIDRFNPNFEFEDIGIVDTSSDPTFFSDLPVSSSIDYYGAYGMVFHRAGMPLVLRDNSVGSLNLSVDFSTPNGLITGVLLSQDARHHIGNLSGTVGSSNAFNLRYESLETNASNRVLIENIVGGFYGPSAVELSAYGVGNYGVGGSSLIGLYARRRDNPLPPLDRTSRPPNDSLTPRDRLDHLPDMSPTTNNHLAVSVTDGAIDISYDMPSREFIYGGRTYTFPATSVNGDGVAISEVHTSTNGDERISILVENAYNIFGVNLLSVMNLSDSRNLESDGSGRINPLHPFRSTYVADDFGFLLLTDNLTSISDLPDSIVNYSGDVAGVLNNGGNLLDSADVTRSDIFVGNFAMSVDFGVDSGSVTASVRSNSGDVQLGTLSGSRGSGDDGNTFTGRYVSESTNPEFMIDMSVSGIFKDDVIFIRDPTTGTIFRGVSHAGDVTAVGSGTYGTNGTGIIAFSGESE